MGRGTELSSGTLEVVPLEPCVLAGHVIDVYVSCRVSGLTISQARVWAEGWNHVTLQNIARDVDRLALEGSPADTYPGALIPWGVEVCSEVLDTFIRLYERQSYKACPAKRRTLAKIARTRSALKPDGERA